MEFDIKSLLKTNGLADESVQQTASVKSLLCSKKLTDYGDYLRLKTGVGSYTYIKIVELVNKNSSANDDLGDMWGIKCIPDQFSDVNTVLVDCVKPYTDAWVSKHRDVAEATVSSNYATQSDDGTITEYQKAADDVNDIQQIASELLSGAAYLDNAHYLIISSNKLKNINSAIRQLQQSLSKQIAILSVGTAPMIQSYLLTSIMRSGLAGMPKAKKTHWSMPSSMYKGYYNLLSKSILDEEGEFIGQRMYDIFEAPVVFDFDLFIKNACIINNQKIERNQTLIPVSEYLTAKLEAASLVNGHRVVHINLTNFKTLTSGLYPNITTSIDDKNRINPFEVFGSVETELSDFSSHIEKMCLLFKQLVANDPSALSIMTGNLASLLNEFYIDQGMWAADARNHRDRLRVIGISHDQVPMLRDFIPYLEERYKSASHSGDAQQISALNILRLTFNSLLDINGDVFDTTTSDIFDRHSSSHILQFDLAKLSRRSNQIAMAQLVNILSTACGNVRGGDVLIIHGVEIMPDDVFEFVQKELLKLNDIGGRYVLVYNDINERALSSASTSDYSIISRLTQKDVEYYASLFNAPFHEQMVSDLTNMLTSEVFIKRSLGGYANQSICQLDMSDVDIFVPKVNLRKKGYV